MTEFIIISIIILISLLYVVRTFNRTFSKSSKQCNACHCDMCPYSQPTECPINNLTKCGDNSKILLPKEKNIDEKTKTVL